MKNYTLLLLAFLFVLNACDNTETKANQEENDKAEDVNIPEDWVIGDFNGDGKKEYMWLNAPELDENGEMECKDACDCVIEFSDKSIPNLVIKDFCIGGTPQNEGDLAGNGQDVISLIPDWFTSTWRRAHVYHLKKNKWKMPVEPLEYWLGADDNLDYIRKDTEKEGHVIVSEHKWTDDMAEVVVMSKSVPVER